MRVGSLLSSVGTVAPLLL